MNTLLVMEIERECVQRNVDNLCDRECAGCDLVLPDDVVLAAYDDVIQRYKRNEDDLK